MDFPTIYLISLPNSRLALHLIDTDDLVTLFEKPGDCSIYLGKPFTNPYRVFVDTPVHCAGGCPKSS